MENEGSSNLLVEAINKRLGSNDVFDVLEFVVEQLADHFIPLTAVPEVVREQNENAYSPSIISIGPLHRGRPRLEAMESVKLSYLRCLLNRTESDQDTLQACANVTWKVKDGASKFYGLASAKGLAEVMLIDGLFIIELLYRNFVDSAFKNIDSILSNPFNCYAVRRDLLLLENQIPYSVLHDLFKLTVRKIPNQPEEYSLTKWVILFFGDVMGVENMMGVENDGISNVERREMSIQSAHHILSLLHTSYLPPTPANSDKFIYEQGINYSATEFRLAGVELKAGNGNNRNLFDIKFTTAFSWCSCSTLFEKGYIEIPTITLSDSTEYFLRNVIAFELSSPHIPSYFTSLAFLLDLLINTSEDVELFEEAGIIRNHLGSREEVAGLFNGICKNATASYFHYSGQYKLAMSFCKSWRMSTGRLKYYYFGSPWSGISVIAAFILFVFAFISTLYTLFSYYSSNTWTGIFVGRSRQ